MLIELVIAMSFLAIAVGALMSVYTSTILSLRHSSIEGNALTLVDKKLEVYRTLPYASIALASVPAASDVYATSPPSNLTAAQRSTVTTGQVTGGSYAATETVTGPDGRSYRVDTYIYPNVVATPPAQAGRQVTVAARLITDGVVGPIRAQAVSAFDIGATRDATN
jgi:hypothetical protein